MDTVVARDADLARAGYGGSRYQETDRLLQLSSWMMILGTVRLMCAAGDYASAFLAMNGAVWPSYAALVYFFQEYSLAILLGMGWPLIMGLILRRSGQRAYLIAASLTFFILALGGILQLAEGLALRPDSTLVIGSFTVSRGVLTRFIAADCVRASMGFIQLACELVTAVAACSLAVRPHARPGGEPGPPSDTRLRLRSRLAVYLTLAFFVLSMRMPLWTAYLEVLNRSSLVRSYVLNTDPYPRSPGTGRIVRVPRPQVALEYELINATQLASTDHVAEAADAYRRIIAQAELLEQSTGETAASGKAQLARALNNLAWMLATCEDSRLRRPQEAVVYAKQATKLAEEEGTYWNTLGTAEFRVQNWEAASQALQRSMSLRGGEGDAFDWFFLAMIDAKRGDKVHARQWYDLAVDWFHDGHEFDRELYRFQVEAAEVLGLPRPPVPAGIRANPGPVFHGTPKSLPRRSRRASITTE
jgi:tetratricopeptide (TPR) repeat protein